MNLLVDRAEGGAVVMLASLRAAVTSGAGTAQELAANMRRATLRGSGRRPARPLVAMAVSGGNSYSGDGGALILQGGSSETGTGGDVIVDAGESGTHEESKEGMIAR